VRRTRFNRWPCPIARAADVFGDGWTQIVMREAFYGCRRFEDFQRSLGVSRATLGQRLGRLVSEGMLEKVPYQSKPVRYEYRLTEKGRSFFDVLAAMWRFGEDWLFRDGPPVRLVDRRSGDEIRPVVVDERSGKRIELRGIRVELTDGTPLAADARRRPDRGRTRRTTSA
jgi:DNA-binding HxlR family transcriptional regulator